jgi:integrase
LLTYAAPLHAKPVREIRRGEIAGLIRDVATARGSTSAMRTRAALSRFWGWMLASDMVEANVVAGTEGYSTPKRSRVLSDGELRALWQATAQTGDFSLILRVMLWTGCRRGEAGGMTWGELEDGRWTVMGERTKNHRPLVLPLPRQAVAALEAWPRFFGRAHLFGRGTAGFQGWSKATARFSLEYDLHDLRRTVETRMAGLGIPKDHVNKILNHADGPVTAAYDQWSYLPEKAAALQRWADELDRIASASGKEVIGQ